MEACTLKLWHATTQKKAAVYRKTGRICSPVRGFTTQMGAMAWAKKRGSPDKQCLHAEMRAAIMLAKNRKANSAKFLYVAAVSLSGNILCAKPCVVCQMMLDEQFPDIEVFHTGE